MRGADVVVHLAWQIQPSHDLPQLHRTNVEGTRHVVHAVVRAGVPHLVVASSVGAYAAGPKDRAVDETWPTTGIPASSYSRHKSAVERLLDEVEVAHPDLVVSRLRPGLVFQERAGSEIARYFLGPFVPVGALRRVRLPVLPLSGRLVFQAVHASDLADAYWRVIAGRVPGAANVAADPVLGPADLAAVLGGRPVPVPLSLLRVAAAASWHARLQPTAPGWVDLAGGAPVMDTTRARVELGWTPRYSARQALEAVVAGMAEGKGRPSPPLEPRE
jgi:nucleoside-diphosphate-sugar epimerase